MTRLASAPDWRHTSHPSRVAWLAGFTVIAIGAPLLGQVLLQSSPSLFSENGIVEMGQLCLLIAATGLFVIACRRTTDAKAIFCGGMALVSALAMQREIPACESLFYEGGLCLTRPAKGVYAVLVVLAAVGLVALRGLRWRPFFDPRNVRWIWPVVLSLSLLALAEIAERRIHPEMEETLELGAYLYLVSYAAWLNRRSHVPQRDPDPIAATRTGQEPRRKTTG